MQIRLDFLLATVCHVSLRTAEASLGNLPSDTTRKCIQNTAGTTNVQQIPFRHSSFTDYITAICFSNLYFILLQPMQVIP
jgi:hypothetical protein